MKSESFFAVCGRRWPPVKRLVPISRMTSTKVFTGYFASKDMFHTIADGIKGLVASAAKHGHLAPMAEILNRFLDRDELTEEQKKKRNQEHKKALESGLYPSLARADGKLHPKSIKSLERMCQMDLNLWNKYPKVDLGIFGMVMTFLDQAQAEHVASEKRSAELDQGQARDPDRQWCCHRQWCECRECRFTLADGQR